MTEIIRKKLEVPKKTSKEYVCTSCRFKTHNKYDYNRHERWVCNQISHKTPFQYLFQFLKQIINPT